MRLISNVKSNVTNFIQTNPNLAKPIAIAGMTVTMLSNSVLADGFNSNGAIKTMVGYVTSILMGVGIIYALIAIFNWVSAIKQEDAERQSKSIVNVFIAGLLIAIKPISVAIISAMGGDSSVID